MPAGSGPTAVVSSNVKPPWLGSGGCVLLKGSSARLPSEPVSPLGKTIWSSMLATYVDCSARTASPLCGVGGTSLAYGVAEKDDESAECDAFGATAAAHATRLANATAGRPACYDALAVLYCAQEPVLSAASSCVDYRGDSLRSPRTRQPMRAACGVARAAPCRRVASAEPRPPAWQVLIYSKEGGGLVRRGKGGTGIATAQLGRPRWDAWACACMCGENQESETMEHDMHTHTRPRCDTRCPCG